MGQGHPKGHPCVLYLPYIPLYLLTSLLISAFPNANQALVMALPSQEELRSLIADLNSVAEGYSSAQDLNGYMSRVEIIAKARRLTQALITPSSYLTTMASMSVSSTGNMFVAKMANVDD
jgi:hypothetical protein